MDIFNDPLFEETKVSERPKKLSRFHLPKNPRGKIALLIGTVFIVAGISAGVVATLNHRPSASEVAPPSVTCCSVTSASTQVTTTITVTDVACKAPTITAAGAGPNLNSGTPTKPAVIAGTKMNFPVSIKNNNALGSTCSELFDLVVVPPAFVATVPATVPAKTGWSVSGYSDNARPRPGFPAWGSVTVAPGDTVVTSVTLTSPNAAATQDRIYIKAEANPDPGNLSMAYIPLIDVIAPACKAPTIAQYSTAPFVQGAAPGTSSAPPFHTGDKITVMIKLTNNSPVDQPCSKTFDLVVTPAAVPAGTDPWKIASFESKLSPVPGKTWLTIDVQPGTSVVTPVVTWVTFTAPNKAVTSKINFKLEANPDTTPPTLSMAYAPTLDILGKCANPTITYGTPVPTQATPSGPIKVPLKITNNSSLSTCTTNYSLHMKYPATLTTKPTFTPGTGLSTFASLPTTALNLGLNVSNTLLASIQIGTSITPTVTFSVPQGTPVPSAIPLSFELNDDIYHNYAVVATATPPLSVPVVTVCTNPAITVTPTAGIPALLTSYPTNGKIRVNLSLKNKNSDPSCATKWTLALDPSSTSHGLSIAGYGTEFAGTPKVITIPSTSSGNGQPVTTYVDVKAPYAPSSTPMSVVLKLSASNGTGVTPVPYTTSAFSVACASPTITAGPLDPTSVAPGGTVKVPLTITNTNLPGSSCETSYNLHMLFPTTPTTWTMTTSPTVGLSNPIAGNTHGMTSSNARLASIPIGGSLTTIVTFSVPSTATATPAGSSGSVLSFDLDNIRTTDYAVVVKTPDLYVKVAAAPPVCVTPAINVTRVTPATAATYGKIRIPLILNNNNAYNQCAGLWDLALAQNSINQGLSIADYGPGFARDGAFKAIAIPFSSPQSVTTWVDVNAPSTPVTNLSVALMLSASASNVTTAPTVTYTTPTFNVVDCASPSIGPDDPTATVQVNALSKIDIPFTMTNNNTDPACATSTSYTLALSANNLLIPTVTIPSAQTIRSGQTIHSSVTVEAPNGSSTGTLTYTLTDATNSNLHGGTTQTINVIPAAIVGCSNPSITSGGAVAQTVDAGRSIMVPLKITNNNSTDLTCATSYNVSMELPTGWTIDSSTGLTTPTDGSASYLRLATIQLNSFITPSVTFKVDPSLSTSSGNKVTFTLYSLPPANAAIPLPYKAGPIGVVGTTHAVCSAATVGLSQTISPSVASGGTIEIPLVITNGNSYTSSCSTSYNLAIGKPSGWEITNNPLANTLDIPLEYATYDTVTFKAPITTTQINGATLTFTSSSALDPTNPNLKFTKSVSLNVLVGTSGGSTTGCAYLPVASIPSLAGPTTQLYNGITYDVYGGSITVTPQGTCTSHNYPLSLKYNTGSFPAGWFTYVSPPAYNPTTLANVGFTIYIPVSNRDGITNRAQLLNAISPPVITYQ